KLLLFVFNGTHPQDPVPVDEGFEDWCQDSVMVDMTFMVLVEQVSRSDERQVISSYSFDADRAGIYSKGLYMANITDDYDIAPANTTSTPGSNDKRVLPDSYAIAIGSMISILLICVVSIFLVFGRQSKMHERHEGMDKDGNPTSNTDGTGDDLEDTASQKQQVGDEEDDIPWVDELPGKLVLIEEEEDCGYDSQAEVAEGRGDVIIPLSIIVAPSARSPSSTESPSPRHSPMQPPTPPPTQPLSRRQVIVLSNHPRPSYVTSIDHDANSEDEEGNQESAPALAPLTAAHWHHDTPLQTPNSVRTATFTEFFASPSAPVHALAQLTTTPQAHWHQETPLQTPSSVRTGAFIEFFASPSAPAPALEPWIQDMPLQTPNSIRTAASTEFFASPSAPNVERAQRRSISDVPDMVYSDDEEPLPIYYVDNDSSASHN
ncbi:hypothetical protein DFQ26_009400, partial [Actinomortierella ambigua]